MTLILLLTLIMFHAIDGHACWINPAAVTMIRGAGQLGYPTGTIINTGGGSCIVREDVNK
jgi:hypothetical protein